MSEENKPEEENKPFFRVTNPYLLTPTAIGLAMYAYKKQKKNDAKRKETMEKIDPKLDDINLKEKL